jgi:hypothetical protein
MLDLALPIGFRQLAAIFALTFCATGIAASHDGRHGSGHDTWHEGFYQKLKIPGTNTSCCNLADCRPTQIRTVGDHYEVMKDGRWIRVQPEKVVKITAPDGGAHICAPESLGTRFDPDYVYCIVMPLET